MEYVPPEDASWSAQLVVVEIVVATEYSYVAVPVKLTGDDVELRVMSNVSVLVRLHVPSAASVPSTFVVTVEERSAVLELNVLDISLLPSVSAM